MQKTSLRDLDPIQISILTICGYPIGMVCAAMLWNFFYSIGSSVISDEIYVSLGPKVMQFGGLASALLGAICSIYQLRSAVGWFAIGHFIAFFLGSVGGNHNWVNGLSAYFGTIAVLALALALWYSAGLITWYLGER